MVAEDSLLNWCKAIDALGQVYMNEFRLDCAKYVVQHNIRFQLRLNEQNFFDLSLGGILKLDKLNMAYHTKSSPSRKPRLQGVFTGASMVSDTFKELIDCGLRKLTRDLEDRSQTIFGEIPIMFACAENAPATPANGDGGGGRGGGGGQLNLRLPPSPANVTQGTLLQLGGAGGGGGGYPRSAMAPASHYGPQAGLERQNRFEQRSREQTAALPPEPRFAEILHKQDLMSAADIRSLGVVDLFKTEPLLVGKCAALLMKDVGCTFPNCPYCTSSLIELPKADTCDVLSALRRCMGAANARSRPGTPRGRLDSVGSDKSVGSQRSDGGGAKPKRPRP